MVAAWSTGLLRFANKELLFGLAPVTAESTGLLRFPNRVLLASFGSVTVWSTGLLRFPNRSELVVVVLGVLPKRPLLGIAFSAGLLNILLAEGVRLRFPNSVLAGKAFCSPNSAEGVGA